MRISELSRKTGAPIPTIKFYIRSGVLERGSPVDRNQAVYNTSHIRRIRLVRLLSGVFNVSLVTLKAALGNTSHTHTITQLTGLAERMRSVSGHPESAELCSRLTTLLSEVGILEQDHEIDPDILGLAATSLSELAEVSSVDEGELLHNSLETARAMASAYEELRGRMVYHDATLTMDQHSAATITMLLLQISLCDLLRSL